MNGMNFNAELDAFMFNQITNGKFEEQSNLIASKVLGYIPFK